MWVVFNKYGEEYCECFSLEEAHKTAREIGGYVRYRVIY